tara:strand:+ start:225 stop:1292 length:1068 start_codon:yes stop_codon:yes gene_type:complete
MANYDSTHTGAVIDAAVTKATPTSLGTSEVSKCVTADASGNIIFPDNDLLYFGTGSDWSLTYDEAGNDDLVFTGSDMLIESSATLKPVVGITNTYNDVNSAELRFKATKDGENGADNDQLGKISFYGQDDGGSNQNFGQIVCEAYKAASGSEEGIIRLQPAEYNGAVGNTGLGVFGGASAGVIDVSLGNDSSCTIYTPGKVGIGTASPSHKIDVVGTAGLSTGTAWTNTSDERIKTNIETIESGLDKINLLRPISFNYTDEYLGQHPEINASKKYNSFIAQEYAEVFPDAVSVGGNLERVLDKDGNEISPVGRPVEEVREVIIEDMLQFTPHDLHMYLVKAVQELSAKVEVLENA